MNEETVTVQEIVETVEIHLPDPEIVTVVEEAVEVVSVGIVGPAGPSGPAGPGVMYTHNQTIPSEIWNIVHNLNQFPGGVTVVDSAGTVVEGDVVYISGNEIQIAFGSAFSGKAYLS